MQLAFWKKEKEEQCKGAAQACRVLFGATPSVPYRTAVGCQHPDRRYERPRCGPGANAAWEAVQARDRARAQHFLFKLRVLA